MACTIGQAAVTRGGAYTLVKQSLRDQLWQVSEAHVVNYYEKPLVLTRRRRRCRLAE